MLETSTALFGGDKSVGVFGINNPPLDVIRTTPLLPAIYPFVAFVKQTQFSLVFAGEFCVTQFSPPLSVLKITDTVLLTFPPTIHPVLLFIK